MEVQWFSYKVPFVRDCESVARCVCEVFIYCKKAELCHLPRVLITESSRPFWAAVVAAPILKLCPAYLSCG